MIGIQVGGPSSRLRADEGQGADFPWGDGIADAPLETLWHPCGWDEAADDELLIYNPSLAFAARRSAGMTDRVVGRLEDGLCVHLWLAVELLSTPAPGEEGAGRRDRERGRILDLIAATGILAPVSVPEAWSRGQELCRAWLGSPRLAGLAAAKGVSWFRPRSAAPARDRCLETAGTLMTLSSLADTLETGRLGASESGARDGRTGLRGDLLDVLLGAFHLGLNAAYVFPRHAVHHQMFTAAGWIGLLYRGRPALLPVFVAEYLVDSLRTSGLGAQPSEADLCEALIGQYADDSAGRDELLRASRRVLARNAPVLVWPRRLRARPPASPLTRHLADVRYPWFKSALAGGGAESERRRSTRSGPVRRHGQNKIASR